MVNFKLQMHVGKDKVLRFELPLDVGDTDVVVDVVVQTAPTTEPETDALGWPIGFFERTYGSMADTGLERPPQGEFEVRYEIE